MRITVRIPRPAPTAESELLVKFVIQRCREVTEPGPILVALVLAALSHDHAFYNRLMEIVLSSDTAEQILRISKDLFMPALGQTGDQQPPDEPDVGEKSCFPDETTCKDVLHYALSESRRILTEKDFQFVRVFEFLIRAGLEPYSFRLYQFEDVRETWRDDPENLVRKGAEIIGAVLGSPRNEN
ncbi:MAG: hypothetical protein WBG50_26665 [Desulfomonilaceae bacterium]